MILQYNNKYIFGLCPELLEQRSEVLWLETICRNSENGDFKLFKEIRLLVYNMEITFNYNKMSLIKTCLLIYILKKYSTGCSLIKIKFQTPLICFLFSPLIFRIRERIMYYTNGEKMLHSLQKPISHIINSFENVIRKLQAFFKSPIPPICFLLRC